MWCILCHWALILMFSSAYQRQWTKMTELLKKKILRLTREDDNQVLSKCMAQQNADVAPCFVWPLVWPSLFFFLSNGDFWAADRGGASQTVNVWCHYCHWYTTKRWKVKDIVSVTHSTFLTAFSLYRAQKYIGGAKKTATEPAATAWGRGLWPGAAAWVRDNHTKFRNDISQNKLHM